MFKILFFSGHGLKDSRVDERHEKHKEQKKNIDQLFFIKINNFRGFPGGAVVENLPVNAGDTGSSPGLRRSHMPRSN